MNNFKLIKDHIDPNPVLDALASVPELWDEVTIRQDYEGSAHRDTKCIFLRAPARFENVLDVIDTVATPYVGRIGSPILELMHQLVETIGIRELGRAMLVKLKPGGIITPHTDEGSYARYFSRFHFVLSGHCDFNVGGHTVGMHPGQLWWFNHQRQHTVTNLVDDRIHLIFDGTAPGYTGALRDVDRSH